MNTKTRNKNFFVSILIAFAGHVNLFRFYRYIYCLVLVFFFILFFTSWLNAQNVSNQHQKEIYNQLPKIWKPVLNEDVIPTLQMLVIPLENSFKKIHTLNGKLAIYYEEGLDSSTSKIIKGLNKDSSTDDILVRRITSTLTFVFDYTEDMKFRSLEVNPLLFENKAGQKFNVKNLETPSSISLLTKDEYLYTTSPYTQPSIPNLPDFPEKENRKVTWREPPENAKKKQLFELIDPCEYYQMEKWGNVRLALEALSGKQDKERMKMASQRVFLFEAMDDSGVKWFKFSQNISSKKESSYRELNTYWNSEVNFHPICKTYTTSSGIQLLLTEIQWGKHNDIWFPTKMLDVSHYPTGELNYSRQMTVENLEINKPIDTKQFSYSALGLEDGDILVDRVKQQVFTIQNDKPVYLAKFNEKYQTPHERNINRVRMFMIILGFALIVLGLYLKIRRKIAEKTPKENTHK